MSQRDVEDEILQRQASAAAPPNNNKYIINYYLDLSRRISCLLGVGCSWITKLLISRITPPALVASHIYAPVSA